MGKIVWLRYEGDVTVPSDTNWGSVELGTLHEGYRPCKETFTYVSMDNVARHSVCAFVGTDGKVFAKARGSYGWEYDAGAKVAIRFSLFFFTA